MKDFNRIVSTVNITVISAQQLRPEDENDYNDVADPYVELFLLGSPQDEMENSKTFKSVTIKNNGFNPIFNMECNFKIYCPESIFFIFKVFDEENGLKKDCKLGWYCIPMNCLRSGYRIVPLFNSKMNFIEFSYLFCKVEINVVI